MFIARKNDVSIAFFSEMKTSGNSVTLTNAKEINFLYHMLFALSHVEEIDIAINDKGKNTLKLKASIMDIEIDDDSLEMVVS